MPRSSSPLDASQRYPAVPLPTRDAPSDNRVAFEMIEK